MGIIRGKKGKEPPKQIQTFECTRMRGERENGMKSEFAKKK